MKFRGEIKFPEIDHPGVPVSLLIEESQVELVVEDESLGRWSLYDVHARRLVASAFQLDLDGTEVTFVADDPIDFAYRGVEHMAETWATLKSKRIATRSLAIRKTRKGTTPSRIEDMKAAMVTNLEAQATPGRIAGEGVIPQTGSDLAHDTPATEWDQRDLETSMPVAGAEGQTSATDPGGADVGAGEELAREARRLEEERRLLEEERARFEEERRLAEEQEANRIEAYRLEMQRLEAERAALQGQGAGTTADMEELAGEEDLVSGPLTDPVIGSGAEPVAEAPEGAAGAATQEPAEAPELDDELAPTDEPETAEPVPPEEREQDEERESEEEPEPEEPEPARPGMVDLSHLEEPEAPADESQAETPDPEPTGPQPLTRQRQPEPAMSGVSRERSGLMGAVRAAFRGGAKDHEHRFIEAPGGIGITRYVCEECGYVSISV